MVALLNTTYITHVGITYSCKTRIKCQLETELVIYLGEITI